MGDLCIPVGLIAGTVETTEMLPKLALPSPKLTNCVCEV